MAGPAAPFPVEEAVPAEALGSWVHDHVAGASGPVRIDHLSGGSSNLTFRVRDDLNDWVLRRPPMGRLLATANDMGREYTVQAALAGTDVPVATPVARCDDPGVIGAPFYLMERLDGVVYDDAEAVDHLSEVQAAAATDELVDVLARLHAVDPEAVGLGGFGRPAGFLERQVARWRTQWEASRRCEVPAIDEVLDRLARSLPPEAGASIVHGDYSFNNTMWDRVEPTRMIGVLDWEMSTLGDPLTDLGMVVMYWGDMGALLWRQRVPQPHRLNPGFPSGDHLVDRYAAVSGRDVDHIDVYCVLAAVKIAVIVAGNQARIAATDPDRAAGIQPTVDALAQLALERAAASSVPTLRR
ncbi:MAG: phosphotransferase family protein [Acidimicrobiales bacterium]|jgi:aminoglycoside phosphotransferase (APT) family kinase protein|nr:phosphotransferase family protein [Acidimicrobiales bacterium]